MKHTFILFLLGSLSAVAQKKPMIPDLVETSSKIPVVTFAPTPSVEFGSEKNGIHLRNQSLGIPPLVTKESVEVMPLEEAVDLAEQIALAFNKAFDTDKFYYQPVDEAGSDYNWKGDDIVLVVYYVHQIKYDYSETTDSRYSVSKLSRVMFFTVDERNRLVVAKSGSHGFDAGLFTYFDVDDDHLKFPPAAEYMKAYMAEDMDPEHPAFSDVLSFHPYQQYLSTFEEGVETGVAAAYEKIMKKYSKKKK